LIVLYSAGGATMGLSDDAILDGATQLVELAQATPLRMFCRPPLLGLGTIDHEVPFQLSTKVWKGSRGLVGSQSPTESGTTTMGPPSRR
jgi:hypothetical protein